MLEVDVDYLQVIECTAFKIIVLSHRFVGQTIQRWLEKGIYLLFGRIIGI
jgi:hypothetical protein